MKKALRFIARQYRGVIRVSVLARTIGISPSRLQHLFKKEVGKPIIHYIKDLRLNRAAKLLRETTREVKEISYEVGFRDLPNFDHAFRQKFGMSPRAYRSRSQKRPSNGGCNVK